MDNQISASLERITELSDDELQELKNSVVSEYKAVEKQENSREVVDTINQLAAAADAIVAERARRETEAAELATAREAAASRINGLDETAAEDAEDVVEEDDDVDPVTGKKKSKKVEDEVVEASDVASVDEPAESTAAIDTPDHAELGVEQPAVQPEEVAEVDAEVGKPDSEIEEQLDPAVGSPEREAEVEEEKTEDEAVEAEDEVVEPETEDKKTEDDESEVEDTDKEEDAEETVTAAGNAQELEAPAGRGLKVQGTAAPVTITAGANIPGVEAGSELKSLNDVAGALHKRMGKLGATNPGADGEQIIVASFSTAYPEDRHLTGDFNANTAKVDEVLAPVIAAGGLCAPVTVSYDIFGFGELGRPVRDSLPSFSADRGGIRFVTPPVLADLNGAVSLWTLQDDIDAATAGAPDPVKPCIRVNCGQEVVVYTDAIPLCLTFGNLNSRAWPELIARHTELGMISHARYAETRLLTRIGALSTAVTAAAELGAARDYFVQLERAAAGYRSRHRLDEKATLRVLLPTWFRNALRADLTKQLPGDGQDVTFNLTDATIDSFFRSRNIEPSWFMDGESGQIFGSQAAGALQNFPSTLVWYLFAEGTFLFLDGGTLDLGLVRDSTLNGTNDYKIFLETFEGVAKVGIESLRVTSNLGIWGAAAATVDTVP